MSLLTAYLLSRLISRPEVKTLECLSVPENAIGIVKLQDSERSTTWLSPETHVSSSVAQDLPAMQDPELAPPHAKQSSLSHRRYLGCPLSAIGKKRKERRLVVLASAEEQGRLGDTKSQCRCCVLRYLA